MLVSGMFVNTRGKRKRNDVFDLPALCSRSHWVPQRELSFCSHPAAPWGAKERVFPPRRGVGQPKSVGVEWTYQSRGHWTDPSRALGGCGNQVFLGSKATRAVQQHRGHCWSRGRTATCTEPQLPGSAALCALPARSSGWLSLTAGSDPMEPLCSVLPSRKGLPSFVLAAAMGTVRI